MAHLRISRLALAVLLLLSPGMAQIQPIDTVRFATVRVLKSGLFSAFADNHEIQARISSGFLDAAEQRVEIVVDSRKLVVLDPDLPSEKRQQVQERMLGPEVLNSSQFREIRFRANNLKQEAPIGSWSPELCRCMGKLGQFPCTLSARTDAIAAIQF